MSRQIGTSIAVLAFGVLLVFVEPAAAGGSSIEFDQETYQPGDAAFAWAAVHHLTTTTPVPTTTVARQDVEALVADRGGSDSPGPLAALVVLGLGVLVISAVWMLLGRRPRSSASGSPEVAGLSDA